jgi:hypothetical protein
MKTKSRARTTWIVKYIKKTKDKYSISSIAIQYRPNEARNPQNKNKKLDSDHQVIRLVSLILSEFDSKRQG